MSSGDSNDFKVRGNEALSNGKIDDAISLYTQGVNIDPKNHVLYSNRSAAYAKKESYELALEDAEKVIEIKPDWPKGYSRKGSALEFMNRYEEAKFAYEAGLKLFPDNEQLKNGLSSAKSHLTGPGGSQPLNLFGDFNTMIAKLSSNPKTRHYLSQPDYLSIIKALSSDPKNMTKYMGDPRVQDTLSVLLGIDLKMNEPPKDEKMETEPSPQAPTPPKPATPVKKEKTDQEKALDLKQLGNEAYKKKDFETAIEHYDAAFQLDPTNITILTNKAAVFYEKGEMEKCREICIEAVDVGRENKAGFKLIAKAYARMGNSYMKEENFKEAIKYYNKSLLENRTKEVLNKLQQCEKTLAEAERLAYIDPKIALEEKNKGNEMYKQGKYPDALKLYTESIKRNPDAAATYSNRAATYMKLAEFKLALKDCETCIEKDPNFVKGHVRKGGSLEAMKEFTRASDAYQKALNIDPNNVEALEGHRRCLSSTWQNRNNPEEVQRRAMNDPEIGRIMKDPAMKMILDQIQRDPAALSEHLKNPKVAANIQKLLDVGILSIR